MYRLLNPPRVTNLNRIALLTSGGDSPGMNPAIRAVVRTASRQDIEVWGVHHGYEGLLSDQFELLDRLSVSGLTHLGGTRLQSARCEAFCQATVREEAVRALRDRNIDGLIVLGGDGSLKGAHALGTEHDFPVLGLPASIDNDVYGSDESIGFDTAVSTAVEAIDKLCDTAYSHDRHFLVEVMGRQTGFLATQIGIASGAERVIIPEQLLDIEQIAKHLLQSRSEGRASSGIILVAEHTQPGFAYRVAERLRELGEDPRVCILGHIQRGGAPSAHDRMLASVLGQQAVHLLLGNERDVLVGIQDNRVHCTPLSEVCTRRKGLELDLVELIEELQR